MLTRCSPLMVVLVSMVGCGDADKGGDVAADTQVEADGADDCGGCADGKVCCPSRFEGDIPRCVDTALNPENCGACGTFCSGACQDKKCITAPECTAGDTCSDGLVCSSGGGQGRCCPVGTTFIMSPADFFGCCPDGDICGCREGNCPISMAAAKRDIQFLDPQAVAALGRELLATRLATYYYIGADDRRRQLGFVIDDGGPPHGIAADGHHVDLYGYVSLAVAALQTQSRELDELRRELDELRLRVDALQR